MYVFLINNQMESLPFIKANLENNRNNSLKLSLSSLKKELIQTKIRYFNLSKPNMITIIKYSTTG